MSACAGKVRHLTRDDALEHIKRLAWKNHVTGEDYRSVGLNPYPCDVCGTWHVGHRETAPLVYHYTTMDVLDAILASDELRPAAPRVPDKKFLRNQVRDQATRVLITQLAEPSPLLWFSRNVEWEYSVDKFDMSTAGRAIMEVTYGGLLRFGVPASFAKLRWADYLARNPMPARLKQATIARGDPREWLATDEPVPLKFVRTIEVYMREWKPVADVDDAVFAAYLAQRPDEYDAALKSFRVKMNDIRAEMKRDPEKAAHEGIVAVFTEAEHIIYRDWRMRRETDAHDNLPYLRRVMIEAKDD